VNIADRREGEQGGRWKAPGQALAGGGGKVQSERGRISYHKAKKKEKKRRTGKRCTGDRSIYTLAGRRVKRGKEKSSGGEKVVRS